MSPPAGQGTSDDDLIVFLVNYVFAVLQPSPPPSPVRVMIGGRSVPSGKDDPPTHTLTHSLAVLLNVSIIFPRSMTSALSCSSVFPLSFKSPRHISVTRGAT